MFLTIRLTQTVYINLDTLNLLEVLRVSILYQPDTF
jgi:hypothetical protein